MATRRRKRKTYIQQLKDDPFIVGKWPTSDLNRAHTISYRRHFYVATFAWLITMLSYLGIICAAFYFFQNRELQTVKYLGISVALGLFMTLFCLLLRKLCRCPLCKAGPLVDGGNTKHQKAFKIRPLSFSSTACLTILTLNRYRCQHCGTPFVLTQRHPRKK